MARGRFYNQTRQDSRWIAAAVVILCVQAIYIIWRGWNYYFFTDDFLNFYFARHDGLHLHYLASSVFGQFAPGFRLGQYAFIHIFGLSFWGVRLFDILTLGSCSVILVRLAQLGATPAPVWMPVAAFAIFSPIFLQNLQWLASSMHVLPSVTFSLAALLVFARPGPIGWKRRSGGAALYGLGLLFYAKTLMLLPLIVCLRVFMQLAFAPRPGMRAIAARAAADIGLMAVAAATYLCVVSVGHYGADTHWPQAWLLAQFTLAAWLHGLCGNALGPIMQLPVSGLLGTGLFVLAAMVSIRRNPDAWLIWLGFAATFVLGTIAIARGRAVLFGPDIGTLARYHADDFLVFLACVTIAFRRPVEAAAAPPIFAADAKHASPIRTLAWAAVSAGLAIYLTAAGNRSPLLFSYDDGRVYDYIARLRATLASLPPGTEILDTVTPDYILPELVPSMNRIRVLTMLLSPSVVMTEEPGAGVQIGDDARLAGMKPAAPLTLLTGHADPLGRTALCSVDDVNGKPAADTNFVHGRRLAVRGWAIISPARRIPASAISLVLEAADQSIAQTRYSAAASGENRGDVAAHFSNPDLVDSGYSALVDPSALSPGSYRILLRLDGPDGPVVCDPMKMVTRAP